MIKNFLKYMLTKINYSKVLEAIAMRQIGNEKVLSEILMAHIFHDTTTDVSWLKSKNFSPHGAAANYSFLYVLCRILNEFRPMSILELGIGQSSKMTTQYVSYGNNDAQLFLVEHDEQWASFFEKSCPKNNNIHMLTLDMESINFKKHCVNAYKDLMKNVDKMKFDFILVDGPFGSPRYSRIGIVEVIKNCLSERFAILIDDVDRIGEKELVEEIKQVLNAKGISYVCNGISGIKSQLVISSGPLYF